MTPPVESIDYSAMIVGYNFVIGILLMLASQRLATIAGLASKVYRVKITRVANVSIMAFGSTVAALSATIYIVFHALRIGV